MPVHFALTNHYSNQQGQAGMPVLTFCLTHVSSFANIRMIFA
jgi:hypothetical protein